MENTYDARGSLISMRDERGKTTTFEYDDVGRRTRVTDPLGEHISFTYGSGPAPTASTDPLGHVTQFEYDLRNFGAPRLSRTIFPDATTTHRTYAASGRVASETDEAGNITLFEYDALGHLVEVTDALGNVTSYAYDEAGNRIRQTDANGQTTTSEYDANGRVTRRTLPLGMSESFTHDAVGNVVSHTDFNGSTTTFEYDCTNRLTRKTYPDSSAVAYTYTPVGQLASVTDARGTTTYAYDVRDRLTAVNNPGAGDLGYTYDAAGNRTSVGPPSGTTQYTYDAVNRLASVTAPDTGATAYTYDAAGNRKQDTLPNGTIAKYTYDSLNRLTKLESLAPDLSVLSSYTYTLEAAGNRIGVTENSGRSVSYVYDDLYRLTQEQITDPVLGNETISYTYDSVGNRLSKTTSGTTNYTYDANDRLLAAGSTTFTYDANGNTRSETTSGSTTTYTYDFEDRLVSATAPGSTAAYVYDDDGARVQSTVNGTVTAYTVDKNRDFAQVLEERDGAGALQASYVYGTDLISQTRGAAKSYYHYDGLGSTRALTNASASATDSYTYDAFGNLLGSTGTTINNYRFAGEQIGPGSSLYYLRARYMAPQLGRFITTDPFLGLVNDPATLHPYSYATNDPVNRIDPSGEFESLSSLNMGQFMQSTLSNLARFSAGSAAAKETVDELNKQLDVLLKEIPSLPLNKNLTAEELGKRIINVNIGLGGIDVELDSNLGGGAVGKAFGIVETLVGKTPGKIVAFMHSFSAASWMVELPEVEDKPGGYLNCEFNSYVSYMYQYQLVAGVASAAFKAYTQAIGAYLGYFNVIELAGATVGDMASGKPPHPGLKICPIPSSR